MDDMNLYRQLCIEQRTVMQINERIIPFKNENLRELPIEIDKSLLDLLSVL